MYAQQEGAGAEVDIDLQHVPALRRRPQETKDGGDLYLPDTGLSRFMHRGPITIAGDVFLGEGPTVRIGDQSYRTRQQVRISYP